jgi:hypothetical protein
VKGDATTAFFGDGDKPDPFADRKDGVRVEVKGQQRNGFVHAARASTSTTAARRLPRRTRQRRSRER